MTRDILFGAGGGEQHLAIVAAVLLGRRHVDAGQALFDGRGAFVGGQDALARRDPRPGARVEFGAVHVVSPAPSLSMFGGWPGILAPQLGRASWWERGCQYVKVSGVAGSLKKKN